MNCYCYERKTNPQLAALFEGIPEGYCGLCEVCGNPGHTRGHPSLPTTGSWCEEHWKTLNKRPFITIGRIIAVVVVAFSVFLLVYMTWRMLR